jgi:hypothetical protein
MLPDGPLDVWADEVPVGQFVLSLRPVAKHGWEIFGAGRLCGVGLRGEEASKAQKKESQNIIAILAVGLSRGAD